MCVWPAEIAGRLILAKQLRHPLYRPLRLLSPAEIGAPRQLPLPRRMVDALIRERLHRQPLLPRPQSPFQRLRQPLAPLAIQRPHAFQVAIEMPLPDKIRHACLQQRQQWPPVIAKLAVVVILEDPGSALEWAESVTLIAATGAPDSAFEALKAYFSDTDIAALTFERLQSSGRQHASECARLPLFTERGEFLTRKNFSLAFSSPDAVYVTNPTKHHI